MDDYKPYDDMANWFGQTTVHPVGLAIVIALALAIIALPRRWAFAPIIVLACVVPTAQRVVIVDLDFDFPRLLIVAAMIRFAIRSEFRRLEWNPIDKFLCWFVGIGVLTYTVLHTEPGALQYRLGWAFDALGFYFAFRILFSGSGDVRPVAKVFIVLAVPVSVIFALELATQRNYFSVFGGVPPMTWIRDGRLRCQGPFAHPIIAGCFWGSLVPIIGSTWFLGGKWRIWATVGVAASIVIVLATNSSTSVMSVIFGAIAILAFPLRKQMGTIRWSLLGLAVVLHMFMKAPVWHLIARLTVFDASTGWHRYFLIDQSIRHFGDWWFAGTVSTDTWQIWDITNQYVLNGIESGFFGLAAFLAMVWFAYKKVGDECRRLDQDRAATRLTWSLGCALFVHCTNFLAVSYFGQARMIWYLLLALIASQVPRVAASPALRPARAAVSPAAWRRAMRRRRPPSPPDRAAPADGPASLPGGAKQP